MNNNAVTIDIYFLENNLFSLYSNFNIQGG
jgi:hypothetical protein